MVDLNGIGMTSQRTRDRLAQLLLELGIKNFEVLEAIRTTPRHIFIEEALSSRAYENISLPIGHSQTISQPYIVAKMTELLLDNPTIEGGVKKVLEVGTGSGYQSTILARLVEQVWTSERILPLLQQAKERFRLLQLYNIQAKHSDGSWGWKSQAPFDGIIVTAAPSTIPKELLEQLADGGKMIIPVGQQDGVQQLMQLTRNGDDFDEQIIEAVSFVPMLGGTQ